MATGTTAGNGTKAPLSEGRKATLRAAASALVGRIRTFAQAGYTHAGKRDVYGTLGYPKELGVEDYRARYERGGIAETLVETYPIATWGAGFEIREDPDPENDTQFEEATRELFTRLQVNTRILQADILAGLGEYAVLFIGAPIPPGGSLEDPLPPKLSPDAITGLYPLAQDRAKVESLVDRPDQVGDPRFGLPEIYSLTLSDKATVRVHWSRVIHIAEGTLEDPIYGKPRLRAVWNYLLDLDKTVGGGAEAGWKRMDPGMQLDIDPEIELSEDDVEFLEEQFDEYHHGLRRYLQTQGGKINMLSASVAAFGSNADAILKLISATSRIPKRIFEGSERGEQASTQDRSNFADNVAGRRTRFGDPTARAVTDRFLDHGVLPRPDSYEVIWPEIDELTEDEKAKVVLDLAMANKAQFEAGGGLIITSDEIRMDVLGREALEEVTDDEDGDTDEADAGDIEGEPSEEELRAAADLGSSDSPDWKSVHLAGDRFRGKVAGAVLALWTVSGARVDADALEKALAQGSAMGAEQVVMSAVAGTERDQAGSLEAALRRAFDAGAGETVKAANRRGSWLRVAQGKDGDQLLDLPLHTAAPFQASFNSVNPRAVAWGRTRTSSLIQEIGEETRLGVRELIAQGLSEGIPPRALARDIRSIVGLRSDQVKAVGNLRSELFAAKPGSIVTRFPPQPGLRSRPGFQVRIPKSGLTEEALNRHVARYQEMQHNLRARTIARRETLYASNAGQREAWLQARDRGDLPSNQKRKWIVTPDERLRPDHARRAGEVTGIDEPFEGGVEPGEEVNCRCAHGLASEADIERAAPAVQQGTFTPDNRQLPSDPVVDFTSDRLHPRARQVREFLDAEGFPSENLRIERIGEVNIQGRRFRAAATYRPSSGVIRLDMDFLLKNDLRTVQGILRHEIQHHRYDATVRAFQAGRTGAPGKSLGRALDLLDKHLDELIKSDGVTGYSRSYWKHALKVGDDKALDLAIDETLAEIAMLRGRGQAARIPKVWNDLYDSVNDAYRASLPGGIA